MNPTALPAQPETIIGLEVHVQLKTQTKLFCGCSTEFGRSPNSQVCPVCLGLPGALPVINREALRLAVVAGLALHGSIPEVTRWDRKNYFYPDLPKGYQISQLEHPVVGEGFLEFPVADGLKRVRIIRAHLEEDAGKSMHDERAGAADSRIDLGRAGTPLLEIVTAPDLRSAEEARAFLSELKLLLEYLGVSDCNMQEGSLRVDANVNLHFPSSQGVIATPIVEIKNLNSFRAVGRALEYEAIRQADEFLTTGRRLGESPKQTRGWDDQSQTTRVQREKEESADYRYFPDPDLVEITLDRAWVESQRPAANQIPQQVRRQLRDVDGLDAYDAEVLLGQGRDFILFYSQVRDVSGDAKRASNWMQQDVVRAVNDAGGCLRDLRISPLTLGELLKSIGEGRMTTAQAKEVFQHLQNHGGKLLEAIETLGIRPPDAGRVEEICRTILQDHPQIVADYRAGKGQALGALIGAARKLDRSLDPSAVKAKLAELLGNA